MRGRDSRWQGASLLPPRGEGGREKGLVSQKGLMKARRISTRARAEPCERRGRTSHWKSLSLFLDIYFQRPGRSLYFIKITTLNCVKSHRLYQVRLI